MRVCGGRDGVAVIAGQGRMGGAGCRVGVICSMGRACTGRRELCYRAVDGGPRGASALPGDTGVAYAEVVRIRRSMTWSGRHATTLVCWRKGRSRDEFVVHGIKDGAHRTDDISADVSGGRGGAMSTHN